jgi:dienelactone hydrolase
MNEMRVGINGECNMRVVARRAVVIAFTVAAIAGAALITRPYVHGLSFVVRAANMDGLVRRVADLDSGVTRERELQIPVPGGSLRARVYEQAGRTRRATLLVSGLHPAGIDEPRLVALSRQLSASGVAVVTPDIPDLSQFTITPAIADAIERAASWLAAQPAFAPDGRVGMMGISFSGGLSMVAAGRPGLRDHVAYVFSLGGHHDLPRVLKYLCTGVEPPPPDSRSPLRGIRLTPDTARQMGEVEPGAAEAAESPPPHDYGVAVILLGVAERVVPRAQVGPLRDAVTRFLRASALERADKAQAEREFTALRGLAGTLREPSATLLRYLNDRDVVHLGARLLPYVGFYSDLPGLSPSRSPKPSAPVFLLHGAEDNVIPAAESGYMAADLRGVTPVRLLLSGLISHADADRPARAGDVLELASFWGDLLSR